jgi:hypothetical protein
MRAKPGCGVIPWSDPVDHVVLQSIASALAKKQRRFDGSLDATTPVLNANLDWFSRA